MTNQNRSLSDSIFDEDEGLEDLFDSVSDIERDLDDKETTGPFNRIHKTIDREDQYD